jgi:hypothetical protein
MNYVKSFEEYQEWLDAFRETFTRLGYIKPADYEYSDIEYEDEKYTLNGSE